MAIIVKHLKNKKLYIFLGVSYSKDSKQGFFYSKDEKEEFDLIAVCDEKGRMRWFPSDDLKVVEIDSKTPKDILEFGIYKLPREIKSNKSESYDICPGCGAPVRYWDRVCLNCNLTLIVEDIED